MCVHACVCVCVERDEAPVIEITEYSNLEEGQIEELITYLNEQVSLVCVCVYMHVCVCGAR